MECSAEQERSNSALCVRGEDKFDATRSKHTTPVPQSSSSSSVKFSPPQEDADSTSKPVPLHVQTHTDHSVQALSKAKSLEKVSSHVSARRRDKVIKSRSRNVDASGVSMTAPPPLELPTTSSSRASKKNQANASIPNLKPSSPILERASKKVQIAPQSSAKKPNEKKQTGKSKTKPPLMTPLEYAQKLQDDNPSMSTGGKNSVYKYLKGKTIFYTGGDMQYAGERTRKRMDFVSTNRGIALGFNSRSILQIVKHGGTLQPIFDPSVATHIVTDASKGPTVRALGLQALKDIPDHIATVTWSWVLSGWRQKPPRKGKDDEDEEKEYRMDEIFMHAAFLERFDAGRVSWTSKGKGKMKMTAEAKGKGKEVDNGENSSYVPD